MAFTYNRSYELGYNAPHRSDLASGVSITLPDAKYTSSHTNSTYKYVKYSATRKYYSSTLPWGNKPLAGEYYTYQGAPIYASADNTPVPNTSISTYMSAIGTTTEQGQTFAYRLHWTGSYVQRFFVSNGSEGSSSNTGSGSLIILLQGQGGAGTPGDQEPGGSAACNLGGGSGGGGGAFAAIAVDMSVVQDLYITMNVASQSVSSHEQHGGDVVVYKGTSASGTKLITVGGGKGGFKPRYKSGGTPHGGAGGTVTVHTTISGLSVIASCSGGKGGTGDEWYTGGEAGGNVSLTISQPMLTSNRTLSYSGGIGGGSASNMYNTDGADYWGGGGGASALGSGGYGGYATSNTSYLTGQKGNGHGAGGGGGFAAYRNNLSDKCEETQTNGGLGGNPQVTLIWALKPNQYN